MVAPGAANTEMIGRLSAWNTSRNHFCQTGFSKVILELEVNNHAGVMSHICGLFRAAGVQHGRHSLHADRR